MQITIDIVEQNDKQETIEKDPKGKDSGNPIEVKPEQ